MRLKVGGKLKFNELSEAAQKQITDRLQSKYGVTPLKKDEVLDLYCGKGKWEDKPVDEIKKEDVKDVKKEVPK